jgi:alkanesulfonate monooxygenase SsuD/methylene tetrahydromethanopterin reductase-like flavin-dependent oxidoreductase (luciferase family)
VELVEQLEALDFDTLWLSDIPMGPSIDPVVGLGYAAAASKRLKLGSAQPPRPMPPTGVPAPTSP